MLDQFSSVQSLDRLGRRGDMMDDPLPVFISEGPCEQFWHGQGCPLFDVVHPAFPLPTKALPTLEGALKDGFGEAVVTCDMLELCMFPSFDTCQKRCLRTHKEGDLAPHSFVGLVLQVGDAEKFPQALGFESLDPFCQSQQAGSMFRGHGCEMLERQH